MPGFPAEKQQVSRLEPSCAHPHGRAAIAPDQRYSLRHKEAMVRGDQVQEARDDKILELAYEAGLARLRQQEEGLTKYRDRSLQLLSAATIATSFVGSLSQFNATSGSGVVSRPALAVGLMILGFAIAMNALVASWRAREWHVPPSPTYFLDCYQQDKSASEATAEAVGSMNTTIGKRDSPLKLRRVWGRIAVFCLLAEIVLVGLFVGGF
jgi:hypothetical protein